jgi:hypothetical protein
MFLFHFVPYRKEESVPLNHVQNIYQKFNFCGTEGTFQSQPHASTELQSGKEYFVTF